MKSDLRSGRQTGDSNDSGCECQLKLGKETSEKTDQARNKVLQSGGEISILWEHHQPAIH
jgi:hypothetical protein